MEALMKTTIAYAVATLAMGASLAHAAEKCSVPVADWKPRAELEAMLEKKGWDVRTIKIDDGCYETYAIDEKGNKVEVYFDPQTFDRIDASGDEDGEG
jgi:hypothetical protein